MHAVILGASKGVGYFALLHLLSASSSGAPGEQWSSTLLLRKPDALKADPKLKPYFEQGRIEIVQGDATDQGAVRKLFGQKHVDLVITSVGATPSFGLTGIKIDQPELCKNSAIALLSVLAELPPSVTPPRVVAVSSMGIGNNHGAMPLAMQLLYSATLSKPHRDKEAMEYLVIRASSALPTLPAPSATTSSLPSTFLPISQIDRVKESFLPEIIIVRPAALVGDDAEPKGRKATRIGERIATYSVRRSDVGRFIAEDCVPGKQEWVNKFPVVGY